MHEKITRFLKSSFTLLYSMFPLVFFTACNIDTITDHGVYREDPQVSGTYRLTVMQSNDPSNLNGRSNAAVNLLDELPCLYVNLTINEDGTLISRYVNLEMSKDADGSYQFQCGTERNSKGTWSMEGIALKMDNATFLIKENQLIDARNREKQLIDLVVFTKIE